MSKRNRAEAQASLAIVDTGATPITRRSAAMPIPKSAGPVTAKTIALLTEIDALPPVALPVITATVAANVTTLASLARNINARFDDATKADTAAYDARIAIGKLLIEARERVDAAPKEHGTFTEWYKLNIKRSKADIYRCISLASSPEPAKAREAEKAVAREGMARTRGAAKSLTLETAKTTAATKIDAAKPNPQKNIWDSATRGLPASATRDQAITAQGNELARKTGFDLATHVETQIRLLTDVQWRTVSATRRQEIVRIVRKMIECIEGIQ